MIHRVGSILADVPVNHTGEGGSIPTPTLNRSSWIVKPVSLDLVQAMVRRHHYSRGGSNTACYTLAVVPVGSVFEADAIAVAWWLPPTKTCGQSVWPSNPQAVLSLSRLVCVPDAPKNTPSFLLAHCAKFIDRQRWPIWITFADSWQGHTGTIYRAAGWVECGKTKPERTYRKNGRMVSRKAGPITRTHQQMMDIGCEYVGSFSRTRFVKVRNDLRDAFEPIREKLIRKAATP